MSLNEQVLKRFAELEAQGRACASDARSNTGDKDMTQVINALESDFKLERNPK